MSAPALSLDQMIDSAISALPRGRRGRPGAAPSLVRDIGLEDLPRILASPAPPPAERPMARIRHLHHQAARLMAEGRKLVEIAEITGYTPARLTQLQNDPTFAELLAHYKSQVESKWLNVHERLAGLGLAMTEELQQRLEDDPTSFTNEELRRAAESLLDRGGFGPTAKREISVSSRSLSVQIVEQIKAESASRGEVRQVQQLIEDASDSPA